MPQQSTTASKKTSAGAAHGSTSSGKTAKSMPEKSSTKSSKAAASGKGQTLMNGEDRHSMIATAAYFRAEQRGFDGSCAMDDWLAAEAEIDAMYH